MWRRWGWWVTVVLVMRLLERWLLSLLLLAKDVDVVLKLYESCHFSVNVLPLGFHTLSCCLPPCDGFLLVAEPLDLLLDFGKFFLLYSFTFETLIFPIFYLDLLEIHIALDDLYWRRRL
jgi:hypothetical protein